MKNFLMRATGGARSSYTKVTVSLSSSEARRALGFFRKTLEIGLQNPTVREALSEMKNAEGKSLADVVIENGKVRPRFGIFLDGINVETEQGLDTRIGGKKNFVVIEVLGRIAGG